MTAVLQPRCPKVCGAEVAVARTADVQFQEEENEARRIESLLEERGEDMAFFDERIEKGLVAKLQGIVESQFVRMDYAEAISVLAERPEATISMSAKEDLPRMSIDTISSALSSSSEVSTTWVAASTSIPGAGRSCAVTSMEWNAPGGMPSPRRGVPRIPSAGQAHGPHAHG